MKKGFCNILFLIVLPVLVFSQNETYYFKNYQTSNGLSSNTITTICQDKKGFMWFGTRNGLNRFDGTAFKLFQNKLSDSTSLGSNSVLSLYEDDNEHLWVGTYKGIFIYDPVKETFKPFKLIVPGEVRYIEGDNNHHIWIVSDLDLYQYNELTQKLTSYKLKNNQAIAIHLTSNGILWAATSNGIIKKYDLQHQTITDYNVAFANHNKKLSAIQTINAVGDTALLIGTMNQALFYNYKKSQLEPIFKGNQTINNVHVHVIFHQNDGNYWLGTEAGLYIFNMQTGTSTLVQKQYSNPYSITDNIISAIYRDNEGGTWIGTYFGGINYYSSPFNNFKKFFPEPGINSLSGNIVHEITKDNKGNLWVGTEDAGLNKIDIRTGNIKHFLPSAAKGSISYNNIHGLAIDGDRLWIGTYEHGLDVMDLKSEKVVRHYSPSNKPGALTSGFIVCIYRTKDGNILVGTWNGLFKYDIVKDSFIAIPFYHDHIQSIHEDNNGTLWISSYGGGVYFNNERTQKKGHLAFKPGQHNGLINNYVNGLFEDSHHTFWFCTEGGLSRYDPTNGRFINYTMDNGLTDNQVFRILEDDLGQLWISTAKGISCYNPKTNIFNTYHTANGLPTEQFNYNSAFKDTQSGTMYFGTVKGMISFKPAAFIKNRFIPPVYLTDVQINNQDINIHAKNGILNQSITYTNAISLSSDSSTISLDFAALSYIIPEMNSYAYKMDGIDKSWVYLKSKRRIYYTKLSPGKYTFRVKASNSDGVWNEKQTLLQINVLPPIYATIWAYLIYLTIITAIVWVILRYYYLALNEKNKRLIESIEINTEREIYNAKIDFFTNIAHEIRTPLTLIKMPLDKLLSRDSKDTLLNESLTMIKKNTNRLIDLTNQLLDFRKAEADKFSLNFTKTDINELLEDVYSLFKPAAESKGIDFTVELPRITLFAFVDSEALKKILSNLFNNAIKYANHIVRVKLLPFSSEDIIFNIEVRNDGYLIPTELREKVFEPFYRIKETEKESGTGIGLPLSRSLAQLHKGTIALKTSEDKENIFLLSLPIHQDKELDFSNNSTEPDFIENAQDAPNNDHTKPTVLLVEDNLEILNYLMHELSANYHVLKATNGQEALTVLQQNNIQLVVSDIMMPVMDGIELCKKMKTDLQYSHVPIILLTAKNSINSKIEGLEVGADAYIEKPFAFEHLQAQMINLISNRNIMKEYFARSPLTHIKGIAVSKTDKDFLEQLNNMIYTNITDINLDVDHLSNMMNMSRPTLYRKIKGLSDMTPNELINLTRLKKAAELLAEGDYKINEVANMIGYNLPSNFSRDFQKQFGVSPSGYVNNLKR